MMHSTTEKLPNVTLVQTYDEVQKFFTWLSRDRQVLGFDTETEGFSFITDKIRLVQFGDEHEGWALPWDMWKGVAADVFKRYEGLFVGHNVKFDINFLEANLGFRLPRERIHDTMIMSRLINWDVEKHALKYLTAKFIDPRLTVGEQILKKAFKTNGWDWKTVPIDYEGYWVYGALDTVLTTLLYKRFIPEIENNDFQNTYDLEMQTLSIAADMEQRGILIDLDYCERKYDELMTFSEESKLFCEKEYGCSIGSNGAITDILLRDGVPLDKKTATGKYSFDLETIERFKDAHPLCNLVFNYRKSIKLGNTYFKNFLEENRNKRIHCSINTLQAVTGRMSVTNPALQTLPRGRTVRDAFIPNEGEKWCSIDFSNIELRVAASFAKEETMIKLFNEGADLHGYLAEQVFKTADYTKEQRQIAKNANFTKIYGGGVAKLAWTAGITEEEAQAVYNGYNESFPEMKVFSRKVMDCAKANFSRDGFTWVRSPSGRRHVVAQDKEYRLINYLVQSEAAEVLKKALVRLQSSGLGKYCLLPVHDEILASYPEEDAESLREEFIDVMQDLNNYAVPLLVEASPLSDSWGEAK